MIIKALKTFSDGAISLHEGEIANVPDVKAQLFINAGYAVEYTGEGGDIDLSAYAKKTDLSGLATSESVEQKIDDASDTTSLIEVPRARYDMKINVAYADDNCTVAWNKSKSLSTQYALILEPYQTYRIEMTGGTWDGGVEFAVADELPPYDGTPINAIRVTDKVTSVFDETTRNRIYTYIADTTSKFLYFSTYEGGTRMFVSVAKVVDGGIYPTMAQLHAQAGWCELEDSFKEYVNKYIATNGYVIGENSASAEEIYDYLLNKDNFLYRGKCTKNGNFLVDKNGEKFNITGIGTHFLSHDFDYLYTYDSLNTLKYLGVNCLRLTSYVYFGQYPQYSYITSEDRVTETKEIIDTIIPIATQLGLYVIIDWHDLEGSYNADRTIESLGIAQDEFFTYFSNKYKNYDNVFYEIFNEPFKQEQAKVANRVSAVRNIVRANNPDAILITGISGSVSTMWNALQTANVDDVFMSAHYYMSSIPNESTFIPNFETYFWDKFPLFNTEWGNAHSSGETPSNDKTAQAYIDTLTENYIPHCVWKYFVMGINRGANYCCVLKQHPFGETHYYKYGGFNRSDLTHNGKFYFDNFRKIHFDTSQ